MSNENFSVVLSHQQSPRVIIAVPHDGLIAGDFSNMFQLRKSGAHGRDLHVWPIVNDIICHSFERGLRVDTVRLLMSRAYIDGNRALSKEENLDPDTPNQTALDDKRLLSAYNHYHEMIQKLVERSIKKHGADKILLIDMHGFGKQPPSFLPHLREYDIILGTANRATIPHAPIDRHLAEFMEQRNYAVFLPGAGPVVDGGDPFDAGQTTRWYAKRYGINTLQIEIYSAFREKEAKEKGMKLAQDISEFLALHYTSV